MENNTMVIEEANPQHTIQAQGIKATIVPEVDKTADLARETIKIAEEGLNVGAGIVGGVEKSRNFIQRFLDYVKGTSFVAHCAELSRKTGVSRKVVAKTFLGKVLGTIGDVLGITIGTVKDVFVFTVDLLATVLKGGAVILANVAKALVRLVTLNKTVTPDLVY